MNSEIKYIAIFITASSVEEAKKISDLLIQERVVACVNTTPVSSIFRWKQKIETAQEILLIAKTRQELFPKVEQLVKQTHSYEVPEIIAMPIIAGSKEYLGWIDESTK